jgi:DNA-binding NtrC family response regulator
LADLSPQVEIIISDYNLNGPESGVDVLKRLTAGSPHPVAAILITDDADVEALRLSGIPTYPILHKPVRPAKLRSLMTHLLARTVDARSSNGD